MQKISFSGKRLALFALCLPLLASLCACDPKYNWREVHGQGAPFSVLLPAKPASLTRPVTLAGHTLDMTMTAAQVDHTTFAVGSISCADAAQAHEILNAMQAALVNNINGKLKTVPGPGEAVDIEASGSPQAGADPMFLSGHFVTSGKLAIQVIVLGPEKEVSREQIATFMSSFKLN